MLNCKRIFYWQIFHKFLKTGLSSKYRFFQHLISCIFKAPKAIGKSLLQIFFICIWKYWPQTINVSRVYVFTGGYVNPCTQGFFTYWIFIISRLIRILATNLYFNGRFLFQPIIPLIGPTTDSILNDGFLLQNHGPDLPWYWLHVWLNSERIKVNNEMWMFGTFLFLVAVCHFDMLIKCGKLLFRIWYSVINYSSIFF